MKSCGVDILGMTLRHYLIVMGGATLICWFAWALVLMNTNPFEATFLVYLIFYASFFVSLVGTLSTVVLVIQIWLLKQEGPHFRQVKKTFRQGIFLSTLLIVALFLQSQRLLSWWNIILLIMAFTFFELFFITSKETY
ncbi:MAG: hypothetical protein AAB568_02345 [Patescibacteria group bacterium]